MVFSTAVFLFRFLPVVLLGYLLVCASARLLRRSPWPAANLWLLLASLFFYAWGEQERVALMLVSIAGNYCFGLWAHARRETGATRVVVAVALVFNLGLLGWFKYANFFVANVESLTGSELAWTQVVLPIGISFFTFQALSYVFDVARGQAPVQRNPLHFATYVALFPQLVAGPIVRYKDVAAQLVERRIDVALFTSGARRFAIGLAKKVLIANSVAGFADLAFATVPGAELTPAMAWAGALAYTIQIYFDFSGYSDMAIGLGRMFGFRFLENFRWPYAATSVTEFWRRWHISLSSWFRDYLYIPLGGNRHGAARTGVHLVTVFFLCGLWLGASWSFVVWGLFHGAFLVIERVGLGAWLGRRPWALRHAYTMLVAIVGWVFFRAESLPRALEHLGAMFFLSEGVPALWPLALYLERPIALALLLGSVGSLPWAPALGRRLAALGRSEQVGPRVAQATLELGAGLLIVLALLASAARLAADTYNPFIYFRF